MSRCWMFTAIASRILVALNYHNITDTEPRNDVEDDIHACVYTCYYFDKTLSLLLLRPQSLPDLKVDPAQLIHMDPGLPKTPMITAIVKFSQLKNTLVDILRNTKEMGDVEKATILSDLVARAHAIHSSFQAVSSPDIITIYLFPNLLKAPKPPRNGVSRRLGDAPVRMAIDGLQLLLLHHHNHSSAIGSPEIPPGL